MTSRAGSSRVSELVEHVPDGRRTHRAVAVRRRGGEAAAGARQDLESRRVGRDPDANGVPTSGDGVGDARRPVQEQRQRTRPARLGEHCGVDRNGVHPPGKVVGRADVDDQRVGRGTALDLEDAGDGGRLLGVGRQPVHRLGGHDGQPAGGDAVGDALDVLGDQRVSTHRSERTTTVAAPRSGRPSVHFPIWAASGPVSRGSAAQIAEFRPRRSRSASATRPGRV